MVGEQLLAVSAADEQVPAKAALIGLLRTLPYEYTEISCQAIDIPKVNDVLALDRLARQVTLECLQCDRHESVVLRTGSRWVPTLSTQDIGALAPDPAMPHGLIKPDASYLVLGGISDIGLVMAVAILRAGARHLVLTTDGHDTQVSADHQAQIEAWRDSFDAYIQIEVLPSFSATDITALIERTRDSNWPLRGVIDATDMHANKPTRLVQALDDAPLYEYWQHQRDHLHELASALDPLSIDYCLIMSSLSAYTGGTGQLAATVAGLYTQAVAQRHNQHHGVAWFVVQWDAWSETDPDAISPQDGETAMSYLLTLENPGLLMVATRSPLAKRQQVLSAKQTAAATSPTSTDSRHERPNLSTPWVAPETEQQVGIAQLWQRFLGIRLVGLDDDFFELGGNSLLAAQLLLEMKEHFGATVDFSQFFASANVRALAELVIHAQVSANSPDDLLQQLNVLEQMSDDEVQALLDKGDLPAELLDLMRPEDRS